MARPLRLEFEGAWYHVMNRGAAHQDIFRTRQQRNSFLNLLREANVYFNVECHAYCLMDNHYHLLMHTPRGNLSKAMRHINGIYTQRFNRSEEKDGSLFRGRYKAILIEEDSYLLNVSRYIHLNPVTAKIVTNPQDYEWSSYQKYIGKNSLHPWLRTEMILGMFGNKNSISLYQNFVNDGVGEVTKQFYAAKNQPAILGNDVFKNQQLDKISQQQIKAALPDYNRTRELPSLAKIKKVCASYFEVKEDFLLCYQRGKRNKPRMIAMYLSRSISQSTLEDIANFYNCKSKSGASNAVYKITRDLRSGADLKKHVKQLEILIRGQVFP